MSLLQNANELSGVRFTKKPIYNPHLRYDGTTRYEVVFPGFNRIISIEIGPQSKPTKEFLIDSLLHEELEARIVKRAGTLYEQGDTAIHNHIYKVIARFAKMKGLWDTP